MLSEFHHHDRLDSILEATQRQNLQGFGQTMAREEESFLRYYYQLSGDSTKPARPRNGIRLASVGQPAMTLRAGVELRRFERSWCWRPGPAGACYYLYSGETDGILELAGDCERLINSLRLRKPLASHLRAGASTCLYVNGLPLSAEQTVILLLAEGLLDCPAVTEVPLEECFSQGPTPKLKPDVEVHLCEGEVMLFRYATGRSEIHPAVLRRFGPSAGRRATADSPRPDNGGTAESRLREAIAQLAGAGFVYFASPADQ